MTLALSLKRLTRVLLLLSGTKDYLKGAYRRLDDKEVYGQFSDDPSVLANTSMKALEKIRLRGDLPKDTFDYFLVKDPKFARFYLLTKVHKRLHDVPGRSVISNCLYPNIPHSEGLFSLRRALELRENKQISSDTLIELAKIVLKNNIF